MMRFMRKGGEMHTDEEHFFEGRKKMTNSRKYLGNENDVTFSFIMPTYNRVFCICAAIDSLLAQTYKEFELLIVDDGSTDGTENLVAEKYNTEIASNRIIYCKQDKKGVCAARNKALELAHGNWIVYLDTDNTLYPHFLETYYNCIEKNPGYNIFYSQMKRDTGSIFGQEIDYGMLVRCNLVDLGTFVHHKSLCKKYGVFDEYLKRLVDWDLILRYTRFEKAFFINEVLLNYTDGNFQRITNTESYEQASFQIGKKLADVFHPFSEILERQDFIEIYFDTGNGFSENEKAVFSSFPVEIKTRRNLKGLRIDPSLRPCIVRGISLKADGKELPYASSNAWRSDGGALWFDTYDPQLYLELPDEQPSSFTFDMRVIQLDEQSMHDIYQQNEIIKKITNELYSMRASRSWRVTRPLRVAAGLIRRIFGR